MNKVKRDYCNKNRHPNWRAWEAKYDMTTLKWNHIGNFCIYCGAQLTSTNGSGNPINRLYGKLTILSGRKVNYEYVNNYIKTMESYNQRKQKIVNKK